MNPIRRMLSVLCLLGFGAAAVAQDVAGPQERVTLSLDHVPLSKAIETFAVEYRLNVVAGPDVTGEVTLNLFDVPVEDALRAMLAVNGYGFRRSSGFYFVARLDALVEAPAVDPVESRVRWLDYTRATEALRLIEPLKSKDGFFVAGTPAENGLESDPGKAGGDSPAAGEVLFLRDKRSVLDDVDIALRQIDRRPRQVLVEAVILEVTLNDETSLGIDFNTLGGVDFADLGGIATLNNVILGPITDPLQLQDGIVGANTSGFSADGPTDGLHIGYIKDDVAGFLDALERVTDSTVLASPRVLAVDRQKAEIIIGAKLGYLSSTTTETATTQDVEFLDVGTQLRFRPFISSDGYVRFEIHPENSTGVVDPTSGLPSETTTEVTTNVVVKDGATIAIGGLIGDQVETVVKQVPFIGSIPLIGWLFRQSMEQVQRREIIVLMTPHVLDPAAPDLAGIAQGDDMANARDLVLREHLPLSRVRLTKPILERAERCLAAGDAASAAQLADAALFLLPADVRAVKLRRDALMMLGVPDRETRTLRALENLR